MSNPQKSASTSRNSSPYPSTSGSSEDLSNLVLPVRTTRSFERQSFNFSKLCLFCSGEASDEIMNKEIRYNDRTSIRKFATGVENTKSLYNFSVKRKDDVGERIRLRIDGIDDLGKLDARYHKVCRGNFFYIPVPIVNSPSKHRKKNAEDVVRFIIEYLQNNKHECQFSVNTILRDYGECQSSNRDIIRLLKDEMGDDIIIHKCKNDIILCYRNTGLKILKDHWLDLSLMSNATTQEKRDKIVEAASEICLEDIRSKEYNIETYPPCNDFLRNSFDDIPKSLYKFVDKIVKHSKKRKKIGIKL